MEPETEPPVDLSLVIPVLDEEESLVDLHREILEAVSSSFEILFVDDGSTDGSPEILESLRSEDPRVRVIRLRRNFGKAAALAAGFEAARGRYLVTLDADGQDDPKEIPSLREHLEGECDLVCGWRRKRRDPPGKILASRLYNLLVRAVTGLEYHDINCGLKGLRREVSRELSLYGEWHRFIPLLARWRGFRVTEVPVHHRPRKGGRTKYGPERAPRGILDLFTLLFLTRFGGRPSHFFGRMGLILSGGGGIILSLILYQRLVYGTISFQYPLLILGVVMVVIGIQLICTGLLAELIAYSFRRGGRDWAGEEITG
jgi:glycosyltransferase involved in cell wall biosynthesis